MHEGRKRTWAGNVAQQPPVRRAPAAQRAVITRRQPEARPGHPSNLGPLFPPSQDALQCYNCPDIIVRMHTSPRHLDATLGHAKHYQLPQRSASKMMCIATRVLQHSRAACIINARSTAGRAQHQRSSALAGAAAVQAGRAPAGRCPYGPSGRAVALTSARPPRPWPGCPLRTSPARRAPPHTPRPAKRSRVAQRQSSIEADTAWHGGLSTARRSITPPWPPRLWPGCPLQPSPAKSSVSWSTVCYVLAYVKLLLFTR